MRALFLSPVLAAMVCLASPALAPGETAKDPDSGAELIGTRAPDWAFTRWVRGPSRSLQDFKGKVVLVRWWTEGCHYCRSTMPVLERLQREHKSDLVVLGVFHPKPEPREVSDRHILQVASTLGFSGPVAFDRDWKTLDRYWLAADPDRNWTSVSFLIDREGIIRWVHGGGEYHPSDDPKHKACVLEYEGLEQALNEALGRRSATGSAG